MYEEKNNKCICPSSCDCQDPDNGFCSNCCPEHNLYPEPDPDCPAKIHKNGATE
jgi:hypothetical protein